MQDKLKLCLLVTEKQYFHKTKKYFIQCLIVCHFDPSKPQGDGEACVLVYCGLFCHLKQLEVTCFRLSAKSPDFLRLAGKWGRQDFICLWFSLKHFPTSKLCWPCEYLILVKMLSNWLCLLFTFSQILTKSQFINTKILSPSKQAWTITKTHL